MNRVNKSIFMKTVLLTVLLWMFTGDGISISGESHEMHHQFKTGERQTYELTIENVYYFHLSKYIPSTAKITLLKNPEEASYDTPEDALISNISAMVAGNHKWSQEAFTPDALIQNEKWDKEHNKGAEWWEDLWRKSFAGKRFFLFERVETGEFVKIIYYCVDPTNSDEKYRIPMNFEKTKDGKWLATRKLPPDDPVSITQWPWPDGETTRRERRVIRE